MQIKIEHHHLDYKKEQKKTYISYGNGIIWHIKIYAFLENNSDQ